MKKEQKIQKKFSLKKLQMAKITKSLSSIKGGYGTGDINDTIIDNTDNPGTNPVTTAPQTIQTSLDLFTRTY